MRLTILFSVFILLYHVSVGQVGVTNNYFEENRNNCPLMEVNSTSNNDNIIEVSYCNHGNDVAVGAYIEIEITNDLFITQSTIPFVSVTNQKYTFDLGDVNNSDCGVFYIEVPNVNHKIHCTNIRIFPNNPCQAMIDRYISDNRKDETYDDLIDSGNDNDGGTNDDDKNGIAITFAADRDYSTPGLPYLGQGGVNSVFEDHVFLNNIPTWDSLLLVLTNGGVLPVVDTDETNTTNVMAALDDITTLVSKELCFNNKGGAVVLTDIPSQITTTATGDRTVFGATTNTQGTLNQTTTSVGSHKFENRETIVRLYPNPFSTTATVTIEGANYKQATLEVIDVAGKLVRSLQVDEKQTISLDRDALSQGVYFYRLIGDNTLVHTGKFVIR